MKIKMEIVLEVDDEVFGMDEDEKVWLQKMLYDDAVKNNLLLHSNDIGDWVGRIVTINSFEYLNPQQ